MTGVNLVIVEENNDYLFGFKHEGYNNQIVGRDHKYGFGNKEEQNELALDWIDITARNCAPALGRWMNVNPLAEEMPEWSSYNYTFRNPVKFADPTEIQPKSSDCCPDLPTVYNGPSLTVGDKVINQLDEIVISGKRDQGTVVSIHTDGVKVWAGGSDAKAGSENISNDRGSGCFNAPRYNSNVLHDFAFYIAELLLSAFDSDEKTK